MKRQGEDYGTTDTGGERSNECRSEIEPNEYNLDGRFANDDDSSLSQYTVPQMLVETSYYTEEDEEEEDWLGYVMRMEALGLRVEEQFKAFGTIFKNRPLRRV
jgi:hypothetical protein